MAQYLNDKHYENENCSYLSRNKVTVSKSLRLSEDDLELISIMYPGKTLSYAIRSCIHQVAAEHVEDYHHRFQHVSCE